VLRVLFTLAAYKISIFVVRSIPFSNSPYPVESKQVGANPSYFESLRKTTLTVLNSGILVEVVSRML
jgi:hypothetical protein